MMDAPICPECKTNPRASFRKVSSNGKKYATYCKECRSRRDRAYKARIKKQVAHLIPESEIPIDENGMIHCKIKYAIISPKTCILRSVPMIPMIGYNKKVIDFIDDKTCQDCNIAFTLKKGGKYAEYK